MGFLEELRKQRWDDHRYYHHNRINQFLHFLSACCFLTSYVLIFYNPVYAVMIGWMLAMVLRQAGHFVFEPLTEDEVYHVSHEYKENVKVGYNLFRKTVLLSIWAAIPLVLYVQPTFFGLLEQRSGFSGFLYNLSVVWFLVGIGAIVFRSIQLFFIMNVQSGLVWATKILTDPFHDFKIYRKSINYMLKGEMYDDMSDWYDKNFLEDPEYTRTEYSK